MSIALCVAGGGSRGILQYGMLKAFVELGLTYDHLLGTSVGALQGAVFHNRDMDALERLWTTVTTQDVRRTRFLTHLRIFGNNSSLYDSSPLARTITKYIDPVKLKSNPKDFYITCTNYFAKESLTRECKTFSDKDLLTFIRASASPPSLFDPVPFEDKLLVDGGLTSNYNICQALKIESVDTIILMVPSPKETRIKISTIIDMIEDCISIGMENQLREEINCINKVNTIVDEIDTVCNLSYRKIKFVPIVPTKPINFGFLDFDYKGYNRQELIEYGYSLAKPILQRNFL